MYFERRVSLSDVLQSCTSAVTGTAGTPFGWAGVIGLSQENLCITEVLMNKRLYCVCAALALVAAPCVAAASNWDGTWKLDPAKSKMTGSTVTITQNDNMYTLDTGSFKFSFGCDGKDYHVLPDRTISCTGSGNSYTLVEKINGKVDATVKRTISA